MTDIVERLREIASLRQGDALPEHLHDGSGNFAPAMTDLLNEAIVEIESLRKKVKPAKKAKK